MAQSWNVSLAILNLCLISAIMTLGVNIQWGYAGIVNFGVMGFAALGGLAGVLVSMPPVYDGWQAGGMELLLGGLVIMLTIALAIFIASRTKHLGRWRFWLIVGVSMCGYFLLRMLVDPAIAAIESINPAKAGHIGGLGLPILLSGLLAVFLPQGQPMLLARLHLACARTIWLLPLWAFRKLLSMC